MDMIEAIVVTIFPFIFLVVLFGGGELSGVKKSIWMGRPRSIEHYFT
jgi:hypothetical protein